MVQFQDTTGGGAVPLCSAVIAAGSPGVATCSTTALSTPGPRTIKGETALGGFCGAISSTASHTVNAAPAAVPTVGEWTLWGLAGLMLIGGGAVASRRFKVARGI